MRKLRGYKRIVIVLVTVASAVFFAFDQASDKYFDIAKSLDIFATLFKEVNAHYVDEIDPDVLISKGIGGMLDSLDPYTVYISEKETDAFSIQTTGQYAGIGALIGIINSKVVVTEPYEGFPAHTAGIRVGDELITVDNIPVAGKSTGEVSSLLKGKPKTNLKVTVKRSGSDKDIVFDLTREKIRISNVTFQSIIDSDIGYIRLDDFTPGAGREVEEAVIALKEKGAKKIILDLRDNPGGLLYEAVNIVNLFIPKGLEVVSTKGKVKDWNKTYVTLNSPLDTNIPVAVLTSGGSASASEIVAGALQDYDRALLVGQQTFGKGLVQTTRQLPYNAQLKVTTAKYYIPSGRCIQALDYTHRNSDGQVKRFADSLKSEFLTKGGRKVYDGNGLEPDLEVAHENMSTVLFELLTSGSVFEYANVYCAEHQKTSSMRNFRLSDQDFKNFISWLKLRNFNYTTGLEKQVENIVTESKEERVYDVLKENLTALQKQIHNNRSQDFVKFRNEIARVLEEEIAFHYGLNQGRIEVSLDRDRDILDAVKVLNEDVQYKKLLSSKK
jgi:carboxyl-terminal processing protease